MLARARRRARARVRLRRRAPAVRGRCVAEPGARERALAGAAAPARGGVRGRAGRRRGRATRRSPRCTGSTGSALNLAAERPAAARGRRPALVRPAVAALPRLPRAAARGRCRCSSRRRCARPSRATDPALLAELAGDPRDAAVRPGPLSDGGRRRARARAARRRAPTPAFCAACHAATGGNPLLLRQLLSALEAEGVRPDADAAPRSSRDDRPARGLAHACCCASRGCPPRRVAVARAVAVLGDERRPARRRGARRARRGARRPPRPATLARAEILRPEPPLGFVHPLVARRRLPRAAARRARARSTSARRALLRDAGARRRAGRRAAAARAAPRRGVGRRRARARRRARPCARARPTARSPTCAARSRSRRRAERGRQVLLELGLAEALTSGPAAAEHLREAYDALDDPRERARPPTLLVPRAAVHRRAGRGARRSRARAAASCRRELDDLRRALEALELRDRATSAPAAASAARGCERTATATGRRARARRMLAGVAALRLGRPRRRRPTSAPRSRCAALADGELIAADNGAARDRRDRRAGRSPTAPRRSSRWDARSRDAHRRGSLFGDLRRAPVARLHAAAPRRARRGRASRSRAGDRGVRRAGATAQRASATPARSSALVLLERGDLAGARAALERGARRRRRRPTRRATGSHAELALLLAEGRSEEALAAADEHRAAASRAIANPARRPGARCRREALDRLGRTRRGARARRARSSSWRARWGAPGDARPRAARARHARARRRARRSSGGGRACSRARTARLEHAKALAALGAALRRARQADRGARAAAPGARARRRLRRAGARRATSAPSSTPPARARARDALSGRRVADRQRAARRRARRRRARPTATSPRRCS